MNLNPNLNLSLQLLFYYINFEALFKVDFRIPTSFKVLSQL